MRKILAVLMAFTTLLFVSCASIPEEQKADTYEVEAYEVWPSMNNIYYYVVYEKDVKLAKKTAEPVFVDRWFERTDRAGVYFLYTTSNKELAYNKSIKLDESYKLGTNSSGPKKYFIDILEVPADSDPAVKIIKNLFRAGRNDRLYVVKLMLDVKEKVADGTYFNYDVVMSVGNKRFMHIYTNDEDFYNLGRYCEHRGLPYHTKILRQ